MSSLHTPPRQHAQWRPSALTRTPAASPGSGSSSSNRPTSNENIIRNTDDSHRGLVEQHDVCSADDVHASVTFLRAYLRTPVQQQLQQQQQQQRQRGDIATTTTAAVAAAGDGAECDKACRNSSHETVLATTTAAASPTMTTHAHTLTSTAAMTSSNGSMQSSNSGSDSNSSNGHAMRGTVVLLPPQRVCSTTTTPTTAAESSRTGTRAAATAARPYIAVATTTPLSWQCTPAHDKDTAPLSSSSSLSSMLRAPQPTSSSVTQPAPSRWMTMTTLSSLSSPPQRRPAAAATTSVFVPRIRTTCATTAAPTTTVPPSLFTNSTTPLLGKPPLRPSPDDSNDGDKAATAVDAQRSRSSASGTTATTTTTTSASSAPVDAACGVRTRTPRQRRPHSRRRRQCDAVCTSQTPAQRHRRALRRIAYYLKSYYACDTHESRRRLSSMQPGDVRALARCFCADLMRLVADERAAAATATAAAASSCERLHTPHSLVSSPSASSSSSSASATTRTPTRRLRTRSAVSRRRHRHRRRLGRHHDHHDAANAMVALSPPLATPACLQGSNNNSNNSNSNNSSSRSRRHSHHDNSRSSGASSRLREQLLRLRERSTRALCCCASSSPLSWQPCVVYIRDCVSQYRGSMARMPHLIVATHTSSSSGGGSCEVTYNLADLRSVRSGADAVAAAVGDGDEDSVWHSLCSGSSDEGDTDNSVGSLRPRGRHMSGAGRASQVSLRRHASRLLLLLTFATHRRVLLRFGSDAEADVCCDAMRGVLSRNRALGLV